MMPLRHMVMRLLGPLALLQLASPAAAQSADSVLVGVLRTDGIVVPYTVYAEGRWAWLPWDSIPLTIRRRDDEPWYLVRAERPPLRLGGGSGRLLAW